MKLALSDKVLTCVSANYTSSRANRVSLQITQDLLAAEEDRQDLRGRQHLTCSRDEETACWRGPIMAAVAKINQINSRNFTKQNKLYIYTSTNILST